MKVNNSVQGKDMICAGQKNQLRIILLKTYIIKIFLNKIGEKYYDKGNEKEIKRKRAIIKQNRDFY